MPLSKTLPHFNPYNSEAYVVVQFPFLDGKFPYDSAHFSALRGPRNIISSQLTLHLANSQIFIQSINT